MLSIIFERSTEGKVYVTSEEQKINCIENHRGLRKLFGIESPLCTDYPLKLFTSPLTSARKQLLP